MSSIAAILTGSLFGTPVWLWACFALVVVALLAFDLGLMQRRAPLPTLRQAVGLSIFYVAVAVAFGAWVWLQLGAEAGQRYFAGYVLEKSLALDNIFVISLILSHFAVPPHQQRRVLVWGILGAIVMRGVLIALGAALLARFEWILLLFGGLLLATGLRLLLNGAREPAVHDNPLLRFMRKRFRVVEGVTDDGFLQRLPPAPGAKPVLHVTPLFLALVVVEASDLVFAMDSLPAIFAITTDPFLVYTGNIFAILGLRALYSVLAEVIHRFAYMKYAMAALLVLIGGKVFWAELFGKPDPAVSLVMVVVVMAAGIGASLWRTRPARHGRAGKNPAQCAGAGSVTPMTPSTSNPPV